MFINLETLSKLSYLYSDCYAFHHVLNMFIFSFRSYFSAEQRSDVLIHSLVHYKVNKVLGYFDGFLDSVKGKGKCILRLWA